MFRTLIPSKTRAFVKERDGRKCVRCEATGRLVLHHILPVSEGGDNDQENLQTLCAPCHKEVHTERGDWYAKLMNEDGIPKRGKKATHIVICIQMGALRNDFGLTDAEVDVFADVVGDLAIGKSLVFPHKDDEKTVIRLVSHGLMCRCKTNTHMWYSVNERKAKKYYTITKERIAKPA